MRRISQAGRNTLSANIAHPAETAYPIERAHPLKIKSRKKPGKEKIWAAVVFLFIWVTYFACLQAYGNIRRSPAVTITFADHDPNGREVRRILKDEEEDGGAEEEICFYREAGFVTAVEPTYGRQAKVFLNDVQGKASLFDSRIRGFSDEDHEGCVIDEKTAEELFGGSDAVGREIRIRNNIYQVRTVLNWKQRLILIHSEEKEVTYSRLFFDCQGENKTDAVGQFLMRQGLSGMQADGSMMTAAAEMTVLLLPLILFLDLFLFAGKQKKAAESKTEQWLWTAGRMLMILALIYFAVRYCRIPSDWLPGKWSDFSFWSRRIGEEKEKNLYFFMLSRTARETEMMYNTALAVLRGALSAVCYLGWIIFRKNGKA